MVYNITIYSIQILNLKHQQVSYHLSILDLYFTYFFLCEITQSKYYTSIYL